MIQPWPKISSKLLGDFRVFSIRSDTRRSPRTGLPHDFFIIDSVNWVNVIALTPGREMVLVEQYRPGSDTVELEIPGGMIDAADKSPEAAAVRELREETGCEGEKPRIIGQIFPNPAILSNTCFTVLVENCRVVAATQFDQSEDLSTKLVPMDEVSGLVASGKIRHGVVIAALFYFELWRKGNLA
ncbi:MAG: NUDIX hydrolase [Limisphaerales bacterium]